LARRVGRRRRALGLSVAEVAVRARLEPAYVERIEERPVALTGGELIRLATALDSSVSELVGAKVQHAPGSNDAAPHAVLEGMRREECVALIDGRGIGRIAYQVAGRLVVVPVNYCWHDGRVVLRTAADSAIAQYGLEPVAFEVDRIDDGMREGWSVLINGSVRPATEDEATAAVGSVQPWAGGERDVYLVIEPDQVSGRRIRS
jgi:nitroimidazol reductase NimA-like FMN-containing flavoprotein (pyridoxamine 5'-phosphate oxidase superfamily)